METMEQVKAYLLGQVDKTTAWVGFIGLVLLFTGFYSILALLFAALVVLPEARFGGTFTAWMAKLRGLDDRCTRFRGSSPRSASARPSRGVASRHW
jgi:hypothetical protein